MQKLIFFVFALFIFVCGCNSDKNAHSTPVAEKGFIDLSNWDFEKDGVVKLKGEWEFYWKKLYTPNENFLIKENIDYIKQPTNWIVKHSEGKPLPNYGYATYRLKIKLNPNLFRQEENRLILGLKVIEAHSAYKLWVDTMALMQNGIVDSSEKRFKPRVKPESVSFYNYKDTLTITINVANYFDSYMSGIDDNILIGTENQIFKDTQNNEFLFVFSFSILSVLGLYHLVVYSIRKKEKINLYFSISCFLFALQSIVVGEKAIYIVLPGLSTALYYKIWLSTLLIFPFILMFYKELFPNEIDKKFVLPVQVVFGIYFLIVVFTKHSFYIALEQYVLYFGFLLPCYLIYSLIVAVKNKRPYAVFVLLFMLIPFACAINDLLFGLDLVVTGYYGPIGFLILIVSHSLIVSIRFTKGYEKVEVLRNQLTDLNRTLELKVEERTAELRRALVELEETNATKNKIFTILAHDLKNIFQTIIGYSDLMKMDIEAVDLKSISKDAEIVNNTSKKAYLFFENLLEWSSSQTGIIKFKPETINLRQSAYECIELLTLQAAVKKISFSVIVPNELTAFADKRMINTILRNLISNAIKFTNKGGKVIIKANDAGGDMVEVVVSDSGIGMDSERLAQLFKPDKLHSSKGTAAEKGTGFGLLLTKDFIETNKGSISVFSELEKGTSVKFTLPKKVTKKGN